MEKELEFIVDRYLCEKIKEKSGNKKNKLYSDFLIIIVKKSK